MDCDAHSKPLGQKAVDLRSSVQLPLHRFLTMNAYKSPQNMLKNISEHQLQSCKYFNVNEPKSSGPKKNPHNLIFQPSTQVRWSGSAWSGLKWRDPICACLGSRVKQWWRPGACISLGNARSLRGGSHEVPKTKVRTPIASLLSRFHGQNSRMNKPASMASK